MSNLEREITFYLENGNEVSISTYKTNEEMVKILEEYNYFINIDDKGVLSGINLKQVVYVEIK